MKNIVKTFVEIYELDMCGRNGKWKATTLTHDDAVKTMDCQNDKVRTVEKTFDPATFTITGRVLRQTEKEYENHWWKGKVKEVV